jgi:hypothetical protein
VRPGASVKERFTRGLRPVLFYLPFHLVVAACTWRDIDRRPAERVRGSKTVWKVASALNTLGALAYWVAGRA